MTKSKPDAAHMQPKTLEEYVALPYTVEILHDRSGERTGWFARVVELPGCMTQADTFDELEVMVQDAMQAWIVTALDAGLPVPEPDTGEEYTDQVTVRVPRFLHRELAAAAARDGLSLSAYITATLGRSLGPTKALHAVHEDSTGYDAIP